MNRQSTAVDLLRGLVEIPSLSTQEAQASHWLVGQMAVLAMTRLCRRGGKRRWRNRRPGCRDRHRTPGPHRHRSRRYSCAHRVHRRRRRVVRPRQRGCQGPAGDVCHGRCRLGNDWARDAGLRLVVVGAVEEEAATSKGARHHSRPLRWPLRTDPRRLHHRRTQRLESHHARIQGTPPRGAPRRPAHGAHCGTRRRRRHAHRRFLELGHRLCCRVQHGPRARL